MFCHLSLKNSICVHRVDTFQVPKQGNITTVEDVVKFVFSIRSVVTHSDNHLLRDT